VGATRQELVMSDQVSGDGPRGARGRREPHQRRGPLVRDAAAAPEALDQIERGLATLTLLGTLRHATNEQVQPLFAEGVSVSDGRATGAGYAANRALRALFDGGWLDRIPVRIPREAYRRTGEGLKESYVNVLGPRGIEALKQHYLHRGRGETIRFEKKHIPRRHQPFIHPYAIVAWYGMGRAAAQARGWRFDRWLDDRELALRKERGYGFVILPDGFFTLEATVGGPCAAYFVEIDLGAETVASDDDAAEHWARAFRAYDVYLGSGGAYHANFSGLPMPVVLIVTTDEGRLATILAAAMRAERGDLFWVTTFARLHRAGFFGQIWQVPGTEGFRSLADRVTG
jgi:hypothetical protein